MNSLEFLFIPLKLICFLANSLSLTRRIPEVSLCIEVYSRIPPTSTLQSLEQVSFVITAYTFKGVLQSYLVVNVLRTAKQEAGQGYVSINLKYSRLDPRSRYFKTRKIDF